MHSLFPRAALLLLCAGVGYPVLSQIIEFENKGLKYQSLTRQSVTIMCARLPVQLKEYSLIQIALANGSDMYVTLKPEDFTFALADGRVIPAAHADTVVTEIMEHGDHSDLVKLVNTYEKAIYGIPNMKLDNGYQKRREAALGFGVNQKFKAAAAASAIALVEERVPPGKSTDGAIFFPHEGHGVPTGKVVVQNGSQTFEFNAE
jgi:putative heme iron utilization protein